MLNISFVEENLSIEAVKIGHPKNPFIAGFSIDSREIKAGECFIAIKGNKYNAHQFIPDCLSRGVYTFIVQKEMKNKLKNVFQNCFIFPVENTVEAMALLAKAYKRLILATSFAITGSSGKTTTRELIVKLLSSKYIIHTAKKNFNNEIGLPLTILQAPNDTQIMVLELGMNHKGEIKRLSEIAEPMAGLITNIGYAHIGQLGSLSAIAECKSEIYEGINPHGYIFLNRDDAYFEYLKKKSPVEVIDYGISDFKILEDKILDGYRLHYNGIELNYPLPGRHNLSNLAGALKVSEFYRVDRDKIPEIVENIKAVSGRSETLKGTTLKGVNLEGFSFKGFCTIINDCYNANPSSMLASLELLSKVNGRRVAILSDMLELGHLSRNLHSSIGKHISDNKLADLVLVYGNHAKYITDNIHNPEIATYFFPTQEELINSLPSFIEKGDTVLVKASRGMKLENTVEALKKLL